jgi:hypothetical protein
MGHRTWVAEDVEKNLWSHIKVAFKLHMAQKSRGIGYLHAVNHQNRAGLLAACVPAVSHSATCCC